MGPSVNPGMLENDQFVEKQADFDDGCQTDESSDSDICTWYTWWWMIIIILQIWQDEITQIVRGPSE